jgi:hypothetical protein
MAVMYKLFSFVIFSLIASVSAPHEADAAKRVALVIGNSAYRFTPPLENPKNDATDLAAALKTLGFEVVEGFDLDKTGMDVTIRNYATSLAGAEVGVFFYAGHGLQVGGQNYLVPVDAQLTTNSALDFELIRLDLVQRTMERETATNILFLDACRNNPLVRNLARSLGTRSTEIGRGLASVEAGQGTLISFSTQPGNVALDGAGRNSPFASALLKQIDKPGEDLSSMLIKVRTEVIDTTQRAQVPWEHSSLTSRFYFSDRAATANEAAELALWERVKGSLDPEVIGEYTREYPQGVFAILARSLVDALKKQKEAATTPGKSEAERQQELQQADQEVKRAQQALEAAEQAKKVFANVSPRDTLLGKYDGAWQLVRLSETCGKKRTEFSLTIKNGVATTKRGAGKVSANGDFHFTGNPADGGIASFTGKIDATSGSGRSLFRRPEKSFSCAGTFTITKVE